MWYYKLSSKCILFIGARYSLNGVWQSTFFLRLINNDYLTWKISQVNEMYPYKVQKISSEERIANTLLDVVFC